VTGAEILAQVLEADALAAAEARIAELEGELEMCSRHGSEQTDEASAWRGRADRWQAIAERLGEALREGYEPTSYVDADLAAWQHESEAALAALDEMRKEGAE
jgi:hypothetical protein